MFWPGYSSYRMSSTRRENQSVPSFETNQGRKEEGDLRLPNASRQVQAGLIRDTIPIHDQPSVPYCLLVRFAVGFVKGQVGRFGFATRAKDYTVPFSFSRFG